jgi:hypothetical protein
MMKVDINTINNDLNWICLKNYSKVMQKIHKIDGRLSPEEIGSDTSVVNLFFTNPEMKIPIIEISVTTSEVQLEV